MIFVQYRIAIDDLAEILYRHSTRQDIEF